MARNAATMRFSQRARAVSRGLRRASAAYIAVQNREEFREGSNGSHFERNDPMSILSLDLSPSAVARRSRRGSWLSRVIAALQESRMRRARQIIAQHRHLLPAEFELAGDK